MAVAQARPPKPPGNGWEPYGPNGWRNALTGALVVPNTRGGFNRTGIADAAHQIPEGGSAGSATPTRLTPAQYDHMIGRTTTPSGSPDPANIKAMQQFLVNRGYKLTVDGINGPLTQAAAEAFRAGRHPDAFNAAHSLNGSATSKAAAAGSSFPTGGTGARGSVGASGSTGTSGSAGASGSGSSLGSGTLGGMLAALMRGGSPNVPIPESLAGDAAAPYSALATQLQQEINNLPTAKANALANIANWFGQVTGAEKTASERDQAMATAGSKADSANTTGIIASLGGGAMAGSGQIGAIGANDANTLNAIGASDAQLSADLAPIFASEEANAKQTMSNKFDQGLADLNNQLASAQGSGAAAKAAALMQIIGANNSTRQQNFSNEASLAQTLAGLQISGMNAATNAQYKGIMNALHIAEINKTNAAAANKTTKGSFTSATNAEKAKVAQAIQAAIADPNTGKLKSGYDWPSALRDARNIVRTNGWNPLDPQIVQTIIQPALGMLGVNFTNPQALYQP